jgi:hypothetical protein
VGIEEKRMARWVLAALAVLAAAALFVAAEAQQGHQTERISGEGALFFLIATACQFLQLELLDFCKAVLCPSSGKAAKEAFLASNCAFFSYLI